ncbi:MAG: hypothetical protein MH321_02890 [Leptospiraceae bacterium]|nr:hypothetical protein [Leptospiraceae bacterium]
MVVFNQNQIINKTGYFTLKWKQDEPSSHSEVYLYLKTQSSWKSLYKGSNSSYSISGLLDGQYEYAICEKELSESLAYLNNNSYELNQLCSFLKVDIKHYNSNQTLGFLSIGLFLFSTILLTILYSTLSKSLESKKA